MARSISQSFYLAAAKAIREERDRQVAVKGYDLDHDAQYTDGELIKAGYAYLFAFAGPAGAPPMIWPWRPEHYKPRDRRSNLIRAGALFRADQDQRCATGAPAGSAVDHLIELTVAELAAELDRLAAQGEGELMAGPLGLKELLQLASATTPGTWLLKEAPNYQGEMDLVGASIETNEVFIAEIRGAVVIAGNRHEEHTANARWIEATQPERLLPLLAEAHWQTIDKAPRDGTEVDLWRDGQRLVGYWWDVKRLAWVTEYGYPVVTNVLTSPPSHFMIPVPGPVLPADGEA